jgi:hypothetical protein
VLVYIRHGEHVKSKLDNRTRINFEIKRVISSAFFCGLTAVTLLVQLVTAEDLLPNGNDMRAQNLRGRMLSKEDRYLYQGDNDLRFTPVQVEGGSKIVLIAPSEWSDVAEDVSTEIKATHRQLVALFGSVPPFRSSVRLLSDSQFYDLTGAPAWTNAMFFRGEIIIPLAHGEPIDLENLQRSVKHEYSHAVFASLSGGAIPGWLDEGLAQWLEGDENPALRRTLKSYLRSSEPVPMSLLQGGFTKLPQKMVPAAYAQSLLAVQALLKAYGVESISSYLALLKRNVSSGTAFEAAFKISEEEFELRLGDALRVWSGRRIGYKTRMVVRGDVARGKGTDTARAIGDSNTRLMPSTLR